jgi:hypothetical protein
MGNLRMSMYPEYRPCPPPLVTDSPLPTLAGGSLVGSGAVNQLRELPLAEDVSCLSWTWNSSPSSILALRYAYQPYHPRLPITTPPLDSQTCNDVTLKHYWGALGVFGFRAKVESDTDHAATLHQLCNHYSTTAEELYDICLFASDIHQVMKARLRGVVESPSAYHYLLAPERQPSLLMRAMSSPFTICEVALPEGAPGEVCWIVDERRTPRFSQTWLIAVRDPAALLHVLSCHAQDLPELAMELVSHGVPFWMPCPFRDPTNVEEQGRDTYYIAQESLVGQVLSSDHSFTTDDYRAFQGASNALIISDGRIGRLSLLTGGTLWRRAVSLLHTRDILRGPSLYAAHAKLGLRFLYRGQKLYEDRLLESEESILIGRSRIIISDNLFAQPSFMPSTARFLTSGLGLTGWSDAAEDAFRQWDHRYRTLNNGCVMQPPLASKWAFVIGNHHDSFKVMKKVIRQDMSAFLASHRAYLFPVSA